mmetsp:Transcript_10512/g.34723  ORF Transcript_10512/g.34723 Transcript_10512/m.34723 type:complete len:278 (-) Transcript_10512:109-942(-)
MAIHILCRGPLIDRLIEQTGIAQKTCGTPGKWDSVEKYSSYCFLYEAIIVGISTYLLSFLTPERLTNYDLLLHQAHPNCGAVVLLTFLFESALPWLSFRQSTRANLADNMDTVWQLSLPLFEATNKRLYATLCIETTYITAPLLPPVRELRKAHRTCSQSGNSERNRTWDLMQEQGNNFIKNGAPSNAKRHDADTHIEIRNGTRSVQRAIEASLAAAPPSLGDSDVEVEDAKLVGGSARASATGELLRTVLVEPRSAQGRSTLRHYGAASVTAFSIT